MLTLPTNVTLYLADGPVDFRRSFDGLAAIVQSQFNLEPMSGDLFVFLNRRATQVRILFFDRDGFCLISKRLEAGTFRRVKKGDGTKPHVEIDTVELTLLLEGVEAKNVHRRKRYVRKNGVKSAA